MNANPILLQKKYARIIIALADKMEISLDEAMSLFYHSRTADMIRKGISDMHCMSDEYLAEEVMDEVCQETESCAVKHFVKRREQ